MRIIADDKQERCFVAYINTYYDEVISYIHDAEFILIFVPGKVKAEFLKRINKNKIKGQIEAIETSDKLTDSQVVTRVKKHLFELKKK